MSTQVHTSNALIAYIAGEHLQDLAILVDSHDLFNLLPGKPEVQGIKTLASWPIFVTAVLNEPQPQANAELEHLANAVRETASAYQIPLIDLSDPKPTGRKARRRKVSQLLAKVRGIHEELNAQLYRHPTERPCIHSPADAFNVLQPFLQPLDHEELWIVNLDTRNRVMNLTALYKGSVNSSQVRVAEVFRQAILDNAPAIILAHNHPSGDPAPSPDDIALTRAIAQAGKLLDIDFLDHVIVGAGQYVSLKERGLGFS